MLPSKGLFRPGIADQDPRVPRGRINSCFQDALSALECELFTTAWPDLPFRRAAPENPSRRLLGRITVRPMARKSQLLG